MGNSLINETTDVLVSKCFGQSLFLKKGVSINTDCILNQPEDFDGYTLGTELVYTENEEAVGSIFNKGEDLEYVFYRVSAEIKSSFAGKSADLEMFYLAGVNMPAENDVSDFKYSLYSSPMYIEYLTLAAFKYGQREKMPKISVKDLNLDALTDSVIYFKQPDIMLYNGKYVLPRDIPPLLLLEIYKLFSMKLGMRVLCFNSFTNSESPVSNFINTALYNYRMNMVHLNFSSVIMSMYNTDYNLYADTAVRLYTGTHNIKLIFPEGAFLSDLSDMRCIAAEYSENIPEKTYFPHKILTEFCYYLSDFKRHFHRYYSPVSNMRFCIDINILALKSNNKIIYVYSEYSDYLKLNIENGSSGCYLKRAVYIDRLPERICGVSIVSLEENKEKDSMQKTEEQRKRDEIRTRALFSIEERKTDRSPYGFDELEPAEAFKLSAQADKPSNKLKDICALKQYLLIRSNTRRLHSTNREIVSFTDNLSHLTSYKLKIINTEAGYELSDYMYDYSPSSYRYSLAGPSAIGETTAYNHILIINNKVYADKNLNGMELDMLLQTLKQPRELSTEELLYRAKLTGETENVFNARDEYIKQEFVPRTDSFHIQSITLKQKNFKPLCVTTIMTEKPFSLSDYLYDVLVFFENKPLTEDEYKAVNSGSRKNLTLGDLKRYVFIYQALSVFLNLYELLYVKICGVESRNLKCIGEIIDDKYFFDRRDENNNSGELLNLFSFELKNTRLDFMLHHEYDLYKDFTYSTAEYYENIESYTRPSYMNDLFLIPFAEADTPEGDNIKITDFPKKCSVISYAHVNPNNKYWYYKILLDSGMTGREIRKKELLGFDLSSGLGSEDILNNLKDCFKEINKMLINTSENRASVPQYSLYSEITDMINEKRETLKQDERR